MHCARRRNVSGRVRSSPGEGDAPRSAFVVTNGMAFRYRLLPDGRQQILTFLIPGDFFDLHVFLRKTLDHSIGTIGPTRIAPVGRDVVIDIVAHHPRIGAALWWSVMQEEAMLRERIVALGRRSAPSCVAYLLCELVLRQQVIGLPEDHTIRLPLTQTDLADALGLTPCTSTGSCSVSDETNCSPWGIDG